MSGALIDRLRVSMRDSGLDAIALTPGSSLRYLSGSESHPSERLTLLLVPSEGEPVAVLPNFEASNWRDNVAFNTQLFLWDDSEGPSGAVRDAARVLGNMKRCAIETLVLRVFEMIHLRAEYPNTEFVDGEQLIFALRAHKQPHEIDAMRSAIAIAEAALEITLGEVGVGVSERRLAGRLSASLLDGGGEGISFGPIVLSGPKSALPHGVPDDRKLERGDYLLIDFGTSYGGYHCDITRTFVVGAEPDAEHRRIYEAVRDGNAKGCAACAPGITAHSVHQAAQGHFAAPEFQDFFTHRTGHGLGLDVHEPPSIMNGNQTLLEPGNVFTVEPGLYREGWGGVRIEDDVLITETGAEILTTFPRELRVVG